MIKEFDVVKANRQLSKAVLKGTTGTVLLVYEKPSLAYEVEFTDDNHDTIELLTVNPNDVDIWIPYKG